MANTNEDPTHEITITVSGYAGTGKSHLIACLANYLRAVEIAYETAGPEEAAALEDKLWWRVSEVFRRMRVTLREVQTQRAAAAPGNDEALRRAKKALGALAYVTTNTGDHVQAVADAIRRAWEEGARPSAAAGAAAARSITLSRTCFALAGGAHDAGYA